jgi:CubicO group peptidase (beta-lactamase class C family)
VKRLLALAGALLSLAGPAAAQSRLAAQVDAYLAPLVATGNFAGVALIARGDQVLLNKGYGLASIEHDLAHTPQSRFQIASVSKPITATAVLKLVEAGRLELDAPISKVLPDYPRGGEITIRQLLTHTAGIPDVNQLPVYADLQLKARTTGDIVAAFKDRPLAFPPGSRNTYSNSHYALLAHIIEKVSGQTYGEFLQAQVLGPAGMASSGHRGDLSLILPHMCEGYVPVGRTGLARAPWLHWSVKTGNGSLYATAGDLHRFVRAYFGGRLLRPDTVREATTHVAPALGGLGWVIDEHLGRRRIQHAGRSPGYTAQLNYYPDEQLTVVVLSNVYASVPGRAAEALAALALGEPHTPLSFSDAPPAKATVERVVGRYRFGQDFITPNLGVIVYEEDGRLAMRADPPLFTSPLLAQDELTFVDRAYFGTVRFEAEPGRPATALQFSAAGARWRAVREP